MKYRKSTTVSSGSAFAASSRISSIITFVQPYGIKIAYEMGPRRAGDLPEFWADSNKATQVLSWEAKRNLQDMCRDTWNWQKQNPNGYRQGLGEDK